MSSVDNQRLNVTGADIDAAAHALEMGTDLSLSWEELCTIAELVLRSQALRASATEVEPAGEWVLVPREPTREMWAASGDAICKVQAKGAKHHDILTEASWNAMLAAAPDQPSLVDGVRVKPLEWESEAPYLMARLPELRVHYAAEVWDGGATLTGTWFGRREFSTLDEAKAAAQADYEQRILSALSHTDGEDGK